LLIPVTGEEPVVAPVKTQLSRVTPQLSFVVGLGVTTDLVHVPGLVVVTMLAGQVIVGGVASFTVTVNEHGDRLPEASVMV
jgi:hypothetical protein